VAAPSSVSHGEQAGINYSTGCYIPGGTMLTTEITNDT